MKRVMPSNPWEDWIPGILGPTQMKVLADSGYIENFVEAGVDHSSFDLHLSDEMYLLEGGAVKPSGGRYHNYVKLFALRQDLSADGAFVLEPKRTYLVKLKERLIGLGESSVYGQATAKSSVGRVDVLARLIVDGMSGYEGFIPEKLSSGTGDMFLEITPMTFRIRVRPDISLSQLRLFYGPPDISEIRGRELLRTVVRGGDASHEECLLSVDLSEARIAEVPVAAFCAMDNSLEEPIDLWISDSKPDPCSCWQFLSADEHGRLKLEQDRFYILRSKEQLALPGGVAAYCRATDETIGEMRIHYAGFVHPLFGRQRNDKKMGTPLIFEVRGHDVTVNLMDGEVMARMTFYRMSEDAKHEEGDKPSPYGSQILKLSKFFGEWPDRLRRHDDGSVTAREV